MKHLWYQQMEDKELRSKMYMSIDWDDREEQLDFRLGNLSHSVDIRAVGDDSFDTYKESQVYYDNIVHDPYDSPAYAWAEAIVWNPKERKIKYGVFHIASHKALVIESLQNGLVDEL